LRASSLTPPYASALYDDSGLIDLDNFDTEQRLQQITRTLEATITPLQRLDLLTERGLLLSRNPETQGAALISLRAALALSPDHIPARFALVDALIATGELEQAFNHFASLVQRLPPEADPQLLADVDVFLEIFISTGHPRIRARAQQLASQRKP
jgi:thioredoxin-like negative regulator of GroEL